MAAPQGNQFWKQRTKHGRDLLFASPTLLWEAASEYFEWVDTNPWIKVEQLKKPTVTKTVKTDSKKNKTETATLHYIAELPTARPYTLAGLCIFLDASRHWWNEFRKSCEEKKQNDFLEVLSRIEEIIYTQKFEGAAVGAFNPSIIARDLGLTDKQEIKDDSDKTVHVIVTHKKKKLPDADDRD